MSTASQLSTVARVCKLTEQMSRVHGLTIRPTSYLRSAAEQKVLFDQHLTTCDGTIIKSSHQSGRAMDFIIESPDDGSILPLDHPDYNIMGACWLSLDPHNVHGGAWVMPNGRPDKVHCEYRPT
jgi:hypothetical protein